MDGQQDDQRRSKRARRAALTTPDGGSSNEHGNGSSSALAVSRRALFAVHGATDTNALHHVDVRRRLRVAHVSWSQVDCVTNEKSALSR